jgi:hypothetical protein
MLSSSAVWRVRSSICAVPILASVH